MKSFNPAALQFLIYKDFLRHFKLEIALAIPASNDEKIPPDYSAGEGAVAKVNIGFDNPPTPLI